ncbi:MAG: prolyl oligopeptidase family serine peptidase [Planctomycetes bacterium]|nr:prolyl oligopeptidase family serine peptidase [Planctomycetota bacterium]
MSLSVFFGRARLLGAAALGLGIVGAARGQAIDRPVKPELRQAFAEFDRALHAGDYEAALGPARRVVELAPGLGTPEYNLACMLARLGQADEALTWLERAIDQGYDDPDRIAGDVDLASLGQDARFERLMTVARSQFKAASAIYLPAELDPAQPAPLLVVLHNFGGNARSAMNTWTEQADALQAILLAPKAPRTITPSQARWTTPTDTERIVLEQIETLGKRHRIDSSRIVLIGLSQGGEMAYHAALRHPDVFCGLISIAGHFAPASAALLEQSSSAKLKVYILVGRGDREAKSCRRAADLLRSAGWAVSIKLYRDGYAFYPQDRTAAQAEALAFVLGDDPIGGH